MYSPPIFWSRIAGAFAALMLTTVVATGCSATGSEIALPPTGDGPTTAETTTKLPLAVKACVDGTNLAAAAYSKATSPAGRYLAQKAVDTALAAAAKVADYISNGKPGVSSQIRDGIQELRAQDTLTDAAGKSVDALALNKETMVDGLHHIGDLCVKANDA